LVASAGVRQAPAVDTEGPAEVAYSRLAEDLRIGVHPPGARLPGERDLSRSLGVSRVTLRKALGRLAEEGRLERSSQRGWFVPSQVVGEPPGILLSFTELARARGLRARGRVLEHTLRSATIDEAERLRVAPAAQVLQLVRLRMLDDVPICVDRSVVAPPASRALARLDLTDRSLFEALESTCGIRVVRSSYSIQAQPADASVAALLGVAASTAVLHGVAVQYDRDDVPVSIGAATYRGDAYRFEADLFRSVH
jgi:GntR family transcriptional regulator